MSIHAGEIEPKDRIKFLQSILEDLKKNDVNDESGYFSDKRAIQKIFTSTETEEQENILVRLTLIDSMYSTQMNRRYYGLQELAERMNSLNSSKGKLNQLFLKLAKDYDANPFVIDQGKSNLFSEKYGIGKDGEDKGIAISLISKYAYFATGYKFPIYDSIACEMYPLIWNYCGWDKKEMPALKSSNKDGAETMVAYLKAINELISRLGGNISYDHLDRLLWFVGKIRRGNMSLVLSREDYVSCVKNGEFNISQVKLGELKFLQKDSILYRFFELAQYLGPKVVKHRKKVTRRKNSLAISTTKARKFSDIGKF